MNKIVPKRDLSLICDNYFNFVEPLVRMRLNFVLGVILKYEGIRIDLNTDKFVYHSEKYLINISIEDKKRISNLFFKKLKKKDRVTIESGKLLLPSNFRSRGIYKSTITNATLNSTKFIDLLTNSY